VSPFNGGTKLPIPYLDQTTFPGTPDDARSFGKGKYTSNPFHPAGAGAFMEMQIRRMD